MIISKISTALPENIASNAEIAPMCGSNAEFLAEKAGIEERRFLGPGEDEISLAARAASGLFAGVKPVEIGLCLWVGQVKTRIIPHASAVLQAELGLPQSCLCFDLGMACSGYVHALAIASSLMKAMGISHAMIATCDPYSLILDKTDRATAPLFGDAATATLLRSDGSGIKLGKSDFGTDGAGAKYLECRADGRLHMDGKGIFNFALRRVPQSVKKCLELNGRSMRDIDYFVFHQANSFIIEQLRIFMNIEKGKCPIAMAHVANTVSSSIPLTLAGLQLKPNDAVILCGFGAGLSWATIYGYFTE